MQSSRLVPGKELPWIEPICPLFPPELSMQILPCDDLAGVFEQCRQYLE